MTGRKLVRGALALGIAALAWAAPPDPTAQSPEMQVARQRLAELDAQKEGDTLARADALDAVVELVWRKKSYPPQDVVDFAERAAAIRERLEPDSLRAARTYSRLANFLWRKGEWERSKLYLDKSFAIRSTLFPPDDLEIAEGLLELSGWYGEMDQLGTAIDYSRRALEIRERKLEPNDPLIAHALFGLSASRFSAGEYEEADRLMRRALFIQESQPELDGRLVGAMLRTLSNIAATLGDYATAVSLAERGLEVVSRTVGTNGVAYAVAETSYGDLLTRLGRRKDARRTLEHSLSTLQTLDVANSNLARVLLALGTLRISNRDFDGARVCLERALDIFETQVGSDHSWAAQVLRQLGLIRRQLGDYTGSAELLQRSLETTEKTMGLQHVEVAAGLFALADVRSAMGDHAEALRLLERSRAIYEEKVGGDHPRIAYAEQAMAAEHARLGRLPLAHELASRACKRFEQSYGPAHPDFAASLVDLARISWWSGSSSSALETSLRAQAIVREHIRYTAQGLSEREALRYRRAAEDGLGVALTVLAAQPSDVMARQVWDEVVRSRALVLDEMAERHRNALEKRTPGLADTARALEKARGGVAHLVVDGARNVPLKDYRKKLRASQDEVERLERKLADESEAFRQSRSAAATGLSEVLRALPSDSALVAFVRYERLAPVGRASDRSAFAYLALIAAHGRLAAVPLRSAARLEEMVHRFRVEASTPPANEEAVKRFSAAGRELRKAIWDPIAPALADAGQVFVVPDADLSFVPLEVLPTKGDRYLLDDGPEIVYLSAERDLLRGKSETRSAGGLLVVGGPDFDATPSSETPSPETQGVLRGAALRFQPLPSALAEIEDVRASWPSPDVVTLSAAQADEASFKRLAPGRRVIHIATHGFFAGSGSTVAGSRLPQSDIDEPNPLSLSGLVFAGANRPSSSTSDDGILTAEEIASLDLRGNEFVVLSSCESGVGPTQMGEGVLGLRRAFAIAGARTLVMSLWPVADHETREWVRAMYRARATGLSPTAAVRRASLDILEKRRRAGVTTHPSAWGAFVAAGRP